MTQCQHCAAKSQLFLCQPHIDELRDMLTDMPRLTQHLTEAATGQTRLGERARRTSAQTPLRINLKASDLLKHINLTLIRWTQNITDSHGITYRAPHLIHPDNNHAHRHPQPDDIITRHDGETTKLALWLAKHADAIAADQSAGDCYNEIHAHIGRILAIINRPIPPRFCGPCPATNPDDNNRPCGTALMARRDAIEVRCPTCQTTHNVDNLLQRLLTQVDHWRFTVEEILLIMDTIGEPLHKRMFQRWRKDQVIRPSGWRRNDGRISLTCHGTADKPVYRLSDIRRAKTRTTTGRTQGS